MPKSIKIVPTLLTHSLDEFKDKLSKVEKYFSLVQVDVMDGKFVRNKTFYDLNKISQIKTSINYELHLMVKEPLSVIKQWQKYKKVKKIIFHYETVNGEKQVLDLISYIKKQRKKAGLAINPETKLEHVEIFLPYLDTICLLGVKPGKGGQKLNLHVLKKARIISRMYPKLDIELDGGVNLKNFKKITDAGINIIAAGTMIFKAVDIKKTITQLKQLINASK